VPRLCAAFAASSLHGIFCVDTSASGWRCASSGGSSRAHRRRIDVLTFCARASRIKNARALAPHSYRRDSIVFASAALMGATAYRGQSCGLEHERSSGAHRGVASSCARGAIFVAGARVCARHAAVAALRRDKAGESWHLGASEFAPRVLRLVVALRSSPHDSCAASCVRRASATFCAT